jgi:hypothetical protein
MVLARVFTGEVDRVLADLLHDGRTVLAQPRKLALGDLGDAGALLPVQRRTESASSSSWSRQVPSSGSRSAGRTIRRSISLLVSPSPRAALPNREA